MSRYHKTVSSVLFAILALQFPIGVRAALECFIDSFGVRRCRRRFIYYPFVGGAIALIILLSVIGCFIRNRRRRSTYTVQEAPPPIPLNYPETQGAASYYPVPGQQQEYPPYGAYPPPSSGAYPPPPPGADPLPPPGAYAPPPPGAYAPPPPGAYAQPPPGAFSLPPPGVYPPPPGAPPSKQAEVAEYKPAPTPAAPPAYGPS